MNLTKENSCICGPLLATAKLLMELLVLEMQSLNDSEVAVECS